MHINPARKDDCKLINLTNYVPDYLQGSETEEFVKFFEDYLNELYIGTCKYVDPEQLDDISYTNPVIWTYGSDKLIFPSANVKSSFDSGDYIKRSTDDDYYDVYKILSDTTIQLGDYWTDTNRDGQQAYYDNFDGEDFSDFWEANTVMAPDNVDDNLKNIYKYDKNNNKIIFNQENETNISNKYSAIFGEIFDSFKLNFNLHIDKNSDEEFAIILLNTVDTYYPQNSCDFQNNFAYDEYYSYTIVISTDDYDSDYVKDGNYIYIYDSNNDEYIKLKIDTVFYGGLFYTIETYITTANIPSDNDVNWYIKDSNDYTENEYENESLMVKYDGTSALSIINNGSTSATFPLDLENGPEDFTLIIDKTQTQIDFILRGCREISPTANTWSSVITGASGETDYGYHDKWTKSFTDMTEFSFTADKDLYIKNGYRHGFNELYFVTNNSNLKGLLDPVITVLPDVENILRPSLYGRQYIDSSGDVYVAYKDVDNNLKLRKLTNIEYGDMKFKEGKNHISILEKIKRLTELHDPDLIDMDYIQYFANYMGYKVKVDRDNFGTVIANNENNWNALHPKEQEDIKNRQLRFMLRNLPNWYKIKTTNDSLKILLYSFGLVTDIVQYYTDDYENNMYLNDSISPNYYKITDKFYATPHFTITVDMESSLGGFTLDEAKLESIIKSIETVKPINTVFDGLFGFIRRIFFPNADCYATISQTITIPWNE